MGKTWRNKKAKKIKKPYKRSKENGKIHKNYW